MLDMCTTTRRALHNNPHGSMWIAADSINDMMSMAPVNHLQKRMSWPSSILCSPSVASVADTTCVEHGVIIFGTGRSRLSTFGHSVHWRMALIRCTLVGWSYFRRQSFRVFRSRTAARTAASTACHAKGRQVVKFSRQAQLLVAQGRSHLPGNCCSGRA